MHAKGLRPADGDTSDCYCIITIPNDKEVKTEVKDKTVNPIWKKKFSEPIQIFQHELKPVKFDFYDKDLLSGDDILGQGMVDVAKCFENPGKWMINKIFNITGSDKIKQDEQFSDWGYFYV